MAADHGAQKRPREQGPEMDLLVEKKIRFDLFDDILDESDPDPANSDLDSVIKSLEEEISISFSSSSSSSPGLVSQPELGYLLEASDDELGLPPSAAAEGERRREEEGTGEMLDFGGGEMALGENWRFEEETAFGAAEFGFVDVGDCGEYLALDGLFDYSDIGFGSADFSWRSESMSAQ